MKIVKKFLIWKMGIIIISAVAVNAITLSSRNFLGGGFSNYSRSPLLWGNLNFDGEHYLAIAQNGYQPLTYFFFPLFPLLIQRFAFIKTQEMLAWTGLIISNLSFLLALLGIYKLVRIDYSEKIANLTLILFLVFPTSFYFGAYYTESLFLALVVWSFYFVRRQKYFFASILVALASATRVIGIVMFLVLLIEWFVQNKKSIINFFEIIFISPLGLVFYLYYMWQKTGDALNFLHTVSIYGDQRSSTLILLPQVIYRYIVKILPNINYSYFPVVFTTYLEFVIAILFLILIIFCFFKLRLSYSIYASLSFLIPTLAGSFSSMPRYVILIFPVFIFMALKISQVNKIYKYAIIFVMLVFMALSEALFWRGYWIS